MVEFSILVVLRDTHTTNAEKYARTDLWRNDHVRTYGFSWSASGNYERY